MSDFPSGLGGARTAVPTMTDETPHDHAGDWCAVCRLSAPTASDLAPDRTASLRAAIADDSAITSVTQLDLTLIFDVSGCVAEATARAVAMLWDALETAHLEHLQLIGLQLVPAAEASIETVNSVDPVPYHSRDRSIRDLTSLRSALSQLTTDRPITRNALGKEASLWFTKNTSHVSHEEYPVSELCDHRLEDHPGLASRREELSQMLGNAIECSDPSEASELADVALQYFLGKVMLNGNGLLGATEAAAHLGVSRQRMVQIAREGRLPRPIARLGGSRPVWLLDDVEQAKKTR